MEARQRVTEEYALFGVKREFVRNVRSNKWIASVPKRPYGTCSQVFDSKDRV